MLPSNEQNENLHAMKQVAIMPFTMRMLRKFQSLSMTPLEILESIELVRALEHGIPVLAIPTTLPNVSVDNIHGLREAEEMMMSDELYMEYRR
jgi:3-deoxy-manno-octulosonate cytidylyltransferase (CMP-KDO synthetase)